MKDTIYGVRIGPVTRVKLSEISVHPLNVKRMEPDREAWMVFFQDVKGNGVRQPIVLTADNKIVQGQRRFTAAQKAGIRDVPARYIEPNPDRMSLLKIIYRDNGDTRRNYSDDELERIVITNWTKERILSVLPRGVTRSKSSEEPLEALLPKIAAISRSRAKKILASVRNRIKAESARTRLAEISAGEMNFGRNRAKEWVALKRRIEKAEEKIGKIRAAEIDPALKDLKAIEKDLRSLGGVERFVKLLQKKKR